MDEIVSNDPEELTAPGLDELEGLIDEAAAKRRELAAELATARAALAREQSRLRFAQAFIVRLFTVDAIPDLARVVDAGAQAVAEQQAQLDGCFVEVDFGFDEGAAASYARLLEAFEGLAACDAIWDVAAKAKTDRTAATEWIGWTRVRFGLSESDLVKCRHRVGRMEKGAGRDIYLFPGFVMVRDEADELALVEYHRLEVIVSTSQFLEEDEVPGDAEVVGETWKKLNEDGSPDQSARNRAIPIMLYGEMILRTPFGLNEAYVVSNYARAIDFARAVDTHREALAALQAKGGVPAPESPAAAPDDDRPLRGKAARRPAPVELKPKSFLADWATLALLLAALTWGVLHTPSPKPPPPPPPAVAKATLAKPAPPPVAKKPVTHKPVRKRPPSARSAPNGEERAGAASSAHAPACGKIRATINPEAVTCH